MAAQQIKNQLNRFPYAYLITIRTYATWLHGDNRGAVDPDHNKFGSPLLKSSNLLHKKMQSTCSEEKFLLHEKTCQTVLQSIIKTCNYFKWKLFAVHVRSNHIHIVLRSSKSKEITMGKIKFYATQHLKKCHPELLSRKNFWSRHGSTKNIWAPEKLFPALYYVIKEQGELMEVYYDPLYYNSHNVALYELYRDKAAL